MGLGRRLSEVKALLITSYGQLLVTVDVDLGHLAGAVSVSV